MHIHFIQFTPKHIFKYRYISFFFFFSTIAIEFDNNLINYLYIYILKLIQIALYL